MSDSFVAKHWRFDDDELRLASKFVLFQGNENNSYTKMDLAKMGLRLFAVRSTHKNYREKWSAKPKLVILIVARDKDEASKFFEDHLKWYLDSSVESNPSRCEHCEKFRTELCCNLGNEIKCFGTAEQPNSMNDYPRYSGYSTLYLSKGIDITHSFLFIGNRMFEMTQDGVFLEHHSHDFNLSTSGEPFETVCYERDLGKPCWVKDTVPVQSEPIKKKKKTPVVGVTAPDYGDAFNKQFPSLGR